jgi:hypothetical protein
LQAYRKEPLPGVKPLRETIGSVESKGSLGSLAFVEPIELKKARPTTQQLNKLNNPIDPVNSVGPFLFSPMSFNPINFLPKLPSPERAKLLRAPEATGADLPVVASSAGVLCVPFSEVQG